MRNAGVEGLPAPPRAQRSDKRGAGEALDGEEEVAGHGGAEVRDAGEKRAGERDEVVPDVLLDVRDEVDGLGEDTARDFLERKVLLGLIGGVFGAGGGGEVAETGDEVDGDGPACDDDGLEPVYVEEEDGEVGEGLQAVALGPVGVGAVGVYFGEELLDRVQGTSALFLERRRSEEGYEF